MFRLRRKDSRQPHMFKVTVLDGHVPGDHSKDHLGPKLDQLEVERGYLADHVKKIPYREGSLRGTLFVPNGQYIIYAMGLSKFANYNCKYSMIMCGN